ncbi:MAG: GTPase Era [Anaplasmataceae bacterium]|nr:GTPase Era [Anaplasmataceae bacterium]
MNKKTKSIYISIIGAPNAGKSTLLNGIIGKDISIVNRKPQTTRGKVRGILSEDGTQLIFVDNPGILSPKTEMDKIIQKMSVNDHSDIVMVMHDCLKPIDEKLLLHLKQNHDESETLILAINKIDKIKKEKLLKIIADFASNVSFAKVFLISALKKNGLNDIKDYLKILARRFGYPMAIYDESLNTDADQDFLLAEMTRKYIFNYAHKEVPYFSFVQTEKIDEHENKTIIYQNIWTKKEHYKSIILGARGETIAMIRKGATYEMQKLLNKNVQLHLNVKVRENLLSSHEGEASIGYKVDRSTYK